MANVRQISSELQQKAIDELFEVPSRVESDIEAFRDWIKKSPHLNAPTDDQLLLSYLRGCKFSLERAKQKFDLHYTLKTLLPDIIGKYDPADEKFLEVLRLGCIVPLPNTETPTSPKVLIIRPGCFNPEKQKVQDVMKANILIQDLMLNQDDQFVISGLIVILDLTNVTISHMVQMQPGLIKRMNMMSQDASPIRQKGFHILNAPAAFTQVFNLIKSFMNEKMRSRIYVHGSDFESLYKVIPKSLMPEEYGGEAGSIQSIIDSWEKKLLENRDYFLQENKYGTDEKKRKGSPKSSEALFGVEGSFRKLEID